ncbi:MAG: hypothetical protein US57_C0001G0041 [Candidatus Moranbacteria bacterium GW2011_GWC2_37_73]|nr:MAG: hypothetical protein UR95_C0001G0034 [Parcubacteria group bacterium GW2011_GWC1_36_108]KKQ00710.1 MAG: hypothetical protein US09_C0007G0041 [Candidatus Moranbacteria bacterium GW2011_GWD1_36_198]KKQ40431.1 MAG: hypothetical protein US57_C0001G0041 [Candidatus Moranbacteria bacterium GW2011_GWC2_37_73]
MNYYIRDESLDTRFHPTSPTLRRDYSFYASSIFPYLGQKGATLFSTSHSSIILLLTEFVNDAIIVFYVNTFSC